MAQHEIVQWAARRARLEPLFLGHELFEYQKLGNHDEEEIATFLQCSTDALVSLALCRKPDTNGPSFRMDVERIADHCGANPTRLANLLREVDALRAMRAVQQSHAPSGLLLAARDRKTRRRKDRDKRKSK